MIHSKHKQPPCLSLKKLLPFPAAGLFLMLCSCDSGSVAPPPVSINMDPVGSGLSVIGFALLAAAVVGVLGKMLK